jgi:hypothetical protein
MKSILNSMRWQVLSSLLLIPSLVGCQTRSRHTVVHHGPRPHVVREVTTTTTTTKPAQNLQPVSMQAAPIENKTVTIQVPDPMKLSPAAQELVKLHESMVGESVMLTFVDHSTYPFNLTADQIVYLQDIGVTEEVLSAMIQRDAYLTGEPPVNIADAPAPQQVEASGQSAPADPQTVAVSTANQPVYATNPPPSSQQAPQTTVTETRVVTKEYFHEQLAPYGAWVHVADYGWCWRPTVAVANVNWRPYYDNGRWIYSDQGWYWHSNYSWGWAPFHYGRWSRHASFGWVWAPDTVWGPSWVTWRYSNNYCGWAPLPPAAYYRSGVGFTYRGSRVSLSFGFGLGYDHYAFVSRRHFTNPRVGRHGIGRGQARNIYNRTTVINNYNIVNNNTVINNGITPERIAAGNSQEIKRIPLKEVSSAGSTRLAATDTRKVRSLPVFRPKLPEQSSKVPQRILNKQSSRVAMARPQKNSENIKLNRGASDSRLATSSLNQRPSVSNSNRSNGNRSSEANLKRPTSSSSRNDSLRTSSRPATSRSTPSVSSRPKVQSNRSSVSSRPSQTTQRSRPQYVRPSTNSRPSVNARSSSTPGNRDRITYTPRPRTSSNSISSRPRTVTPNTSSRPSYRTQPSRTQSQPRTYSRPAPQTSRRPTITPRSTPAPQTRSIAPRSQPQPSRSISRPAPSSSRPSSGSVSQRSITPPSSRSIPSFRSSAPASGSRPSSPSSGGSSSSSRPSRPGR